VTAWEAAAYLDEAMTFPGILGADDATCPLPGSGTRQVRQARWRDAAPHEANSITVDDGVQLEVLDFGGQGSPIVLLPGLGATAHAYDELGPQLARNHRVIAITRRGTGYSSRPDFGFDTPRLAQDVLAVMDQMKLEKVLLVGHSIAGEELTWLGGHHGERFTGLVYLDAAFDRTAGRADPVEKRVRELQRSMPPPPPITAEALLDYEAMTAFLAKRGNLRPPEGELIAFLNVDKANVAGTPNMDDHLQEAIQAAIQAPDYSRVKIPALAVYAFRDPDEPPPAWYDTSDPQLMANVAELRQFEDTRKLVHIDAFRRGVEKGRVLAIQKARHYILQSNPREVLEAIETFAAELAAQ
jgi:non-heme chloroperoxidase